jgi:CheY-like chemotaxis protein/tetratricopeptide (TPR) repeat protein
MKTPSQLIMLRNQTRGLGIVEQARLCCQAAKQLEKAGEYESGFEALQAFWSERDASPIVEGLDQRSMAELLMRIGALAGWLDSTQQAARGQENAKNLITQSIEIFELLGDVEKLAEARADLALCYWREGSLDEARIHLADALSFANSLNQNNDLKATILIRSGIVEMGGQRLNDALRISNEAAALVEQSSDEALKGTFHNYFAMLYNRMGAAENRLDYVDRALIEYAAAGFHFEQAGHVRFQGCVENNLGFLFFQLGRFADAHRHLERAERLFVEKDDQLHIAQITETRARTFLAEGRLQEADRAVRAAIKTLERGGEQALLAEAVTTQGLVSARMGNYLRSKVLLDRAVEIAASAGDFESAGRAKLCIIEELAEQIPSTELASIYESAVALLHGSQDPSSGRRLIACARRVIDVLESDRLVEYVCPEDHSWEGFSFKQEVLKNERALIARALRDAGGAVTVAARLLGFKHHQSLASLINNRHTDLLQTRSAVRPRRGPKAQRTNGKFIGQKPRPAASQLCILYVQNDNHVGQRVDEMFSPDEWFVELCHDGNSALRKLAGIDRYDLLVIDKDLSGLSGVDLVKSARKITHRRRTPVIMISASDCETEAWRAGVDAFLKRPEQINELMSTIGRLLPR